MVGEQAVNLFVFEDAGLFLSRAQRALESHEAQNNLMLGVALRLKAHPDWIKTRPYLAVVEENDQFLAAALMTPPRALQLVCPTNDEIAMWLIAQNLIESGWPVSGVIAHQPVAETFSQLWQRMTGCAVEVKRRLEAYRLDTVKFPEQMRGTLRQGTMEDLSWIAHWLLGFLQDTDQGDDLKAAQKMAQHNLQMGDLFVWEEDGRPLSMAARTRPLRTGIAITMVYTPPENRGRGYASACVASLCQMLLDSGWKYCVLFVDQTNPAANAVYRRVGFIPLDRVLESSFSMPG